jgi:hypothetical protein
MVDVKKIQQLLAKHFEIHGNISVDPKTGSVDVDGSVELNDSIAVTQLPVHFGHVSGDFYCSASKLKTLEGAPGHVSGDFYCSANQLKTLEGAPGHVGGDFDCNNNQLKTLEGAPDAVGGSFYCNNNQLKTLEGAPGYVDGGFYCNSNQLKTLEGAPGHVGGRFFCHNNQLITLDDAPGHVGGEFWVDYQPSLPLLRLLQYPRVEIQNCPPIVKSIITKYAGTGKRGMLAAGVELTRAGFKDNARW